MEKKNNRKILEYFTCENKEHWLREIQKSDWGAGQYLYSLLKENKLKALVGATTLVLMLADGDKLVSFCTLAPLDCSRHHTRRGPGLCIHSRSTAGSTVPVGFWTARKASRPSWNGSTPTFLPITSGCMKNAAIHF